MVLVSDDCPRDAQDDGLSHLARLKNLRHLDLSGCSKLTDRALSLLAPLLNLNTLLIGGW